MTKEAFALLAGQYLGFRSVKYDGAGQGDSLTGFDCSGFVCFLLGQIGYPTLVPRHCNEMFDSLGIFVHYQFRNVGDLVFFSRRGLCPSHVGIMVSQDEYIHSPGINGQVICVSKLEQRMIDSLGNPAQIYSFNPIGFKRIMLKEGRHQQPFFSE